MSLNELVGKTLDPRNFLINSSKDVIIFDLDQDLIFCAEGDCCSHSWIQHITGVDVFTDGFSSVKILSVEDLGEVDGFDETDDEYIRVYKTQIKTNLGICDIEYRNSSNGYYGGSLEKMDKNTLLKYHLVGEMYVKLKDF